MDPTVRPARDVGAKAVSPPLGAREASKSNYAGWPESTVWLLQVVKAYTFITHLDRLIVDLNQIQ